MRTSSGVLGWGLFFIVFGGLVLAVNQGYLDRGLLAQAWRLWPLILVGIGVGLVLRETPLSLLGTFVVAAVFGAIAAAFVTGGFGGVGCGAAQDRVTAAPGEDGTTVFERSGELADGAAITVSFDCGDLRVSTASGGGWALTASDSGEGSPEIEEAAEAVSISTGGNGARIPFIDASRRSWQVRVPSDVHLGQLAVDVSAGEGRLTLEGLDAEALRVTANAADTTLDLSGAHIESLELTANAASVRLLLPTSPFDEATVHANAGSVEICRPPNVPLEITARGAVADTDFSDAGLVESDDVWRTPDFGDGTGALRLTVEANAASVDVLTIQECR